MGSDPINCINWEISPLKGIDKNGGKYGFFHDNLSPCANEYIFLSEIRASCQFVDFMDFVDFMVKYYL